MRELTLEEMDCVSGGDDWTEEISAYCTNTNCFLVYTQPLQSGSTITAQLGFNSSSITSISGGYSYNGQSYNFQINPQNGNMAGSYTQQLSGGWTGTFNVYSNGSGGTGVGVTLTHSF